MMLLVDFLYNNYQFPVLFASEVVAAGHPVADHAIEGVLHLPPIWMVIP